MGMPKTKTKDNKLKVPSVCALCKSSEDDEFRFGKFYRSRDLSIHNFCMLFSSDLSQNGKNDDDGFAGFLPKDIKKEVFRGRRLKCSYCKSSGATIGCCVPVCKKVFHFTCGQKNNSLHLFFDSFLSYCSAHKAKPIYPEGEKLSKEYTCSICCETVYLKNYDTTVWTSCCKNGWFHKPCIQRQAHNAGYFFRCPLCNNTEKFQKQMLLHGIFIPQQDAAWELEENAFQELLFRHEQCDAVVCLCPKGRKHHTKTSRQWRIVICEDCGSQGRHVGCEDSVTPKFTWQCYACKEITARMKPKKESECLNNKGKKGKSPKTGRKSELKQAGSSGRTLRSSLCTSSTESTSSVKDEILSTSEEPPLLSKQDVSLVSEKKSDEATSTALGRGAAPVDTKSKYRITKITKRGQEDLSRSKRNSVPCAAQPETKDLYVNLGTKECRESSNLEEDYLFSDVAPSLPESNFDCFSDKSEVSHRSDKHESDAEFPDDFVKCDSSDKCKETNDLFTAGSSTSDICDGRNVDLQRNVSELEKLLCGDSSSVETKNCKVTTTVSNNVDCKYFASEDSKPEGVLCKENNKESRMEEVSVVEDNSKFSFSPEKLKNTYNKHGKHSKRICIEEKEDRHCKRQKLSVSTENSLSSVVVFSLVQDIKQNIDAEHKYALNPDHKITTEVISLPSVSDSIERYSRRTDEERSNKSLGAETVLSNNKTCVVTKFHGSLHNGERDPLMKLPAVHNKLAKKTVKTRCTEENCEVPHNGAHGSKHHPLSENKTLKKEKVNVLSKKNYGTLRCKDNYRCIKALFGGPCRCCEDKSKFRKELSAKSKSSKKCSRHCRPQYNIECIGKKSEEMPVGTKHSCSRPTNYIVNFWQPGRQMSAVNEMKEKLSPKPQVIHLKTVPN